MDPTLAALIEERLTGVAAPPAQVAELVVAACAGSDALAAALGSGACPDGLVAGSERATPPRVHLRSLTVSGFRGIGPPARLELDPGPGLTLVVGRNGSGKSSFAEALELLLTGANRRWQDKSRVWVDGWRNMHWEGAAEIEAEFAMEGSSDGGRVVCRWNEGAALSDRGVTASGVDLTEWGPSLEAYRPFLSYSELGALFDGKPSDLYDALSSILGLGDIAAALESLREARLERERSLKETRGDLGRLIVLLDETDDQRARRCREALAGSAWDLDTVEQVLGGVTDGEDPAEALAVLGGLAALEPPSVVAAAAAAGQLERATDEMERLAGTDAADAHALADLLGRALEVHEHHRGDDCPVCGTRGAIGPNWAEATRGQLDRLRERAAEYEAAQANLRDAIEAARALCTAPPAVLDRADRVGVDVEPLRAAWRRSAEAPDDSRALATHLRSSVAHLAQAVAEVAEAAATERERREDVWRPVARELGAWLPAARRAVADAESLPRIKEAEQWLKDATDALRRERFAPIGDAARRNWERLRQQSSVTLENLGLEGSGNRRRVALDVTIDGVEGSALGVMSQGEINSLALSVFLPRAAMPASPFRFIVIDDPVQSMDPAKVDGLAEVLGEAAQGRQVIVFTHDDRLPEAVERLRVPARILEVARRARSAVEVRERGTPAGQLLQDARALAHSEEIPIDIRGRLVPGFCRQAIEAACAQRVRRRRIGRGESHAEVERALGEATTLKTRVALAIFDDATRAGDVLGRLNHRHGMWAADTLQRVDRGSHRGDHGDLLELINRSSSLAQEIAKAA